VHGALLAALGFAERALDPELNGAAENPVLLLESERVISTGNFHTPLLALALDQLALAAAQLAANVLARGARLMQERFSGLPNNLIARDAGYSGFAPVMKVGEALLGEIRHLAQPVSGDLRWGADGTEDDVTNTPLAGKKLLALLERLRHLLALELMLAAQAVELAHPSHLGQPMQRAYECVRDLSQPLVEDRPLGGDLMRLSEELLGGRRLLKDVEDAL
jgi:histidine ammonia-lyase